MDYVNCSGKGSRAVEIHHLSKSHIGRLKDHNFKSQEIGSLTVSNWFKVTLELAQITAYEAIVVIQSDLLQFLKMILQDYLFFVVYIVAYGQTHQLGRGFIIRR